MVTSSKASIFLFVGTERYLKDNELKKLRASLSGTDSSNLDYKIFYAGETNIGRILDYVNASSLFFSKRLAVIRDPEKLPKEDRVRLARYISNPSDSAFLVMDTEDGSMIKELAPVARNIRILRFGELTDSEVLAWIERYALSKGKEISHDAVHALKELTGPSLLILSCELEKLAIYSGRRPWIEVGDVESLVGKSTIASGFDIAWAIGEKNINKALAIVSDLVMSGKRPHEIIGLLCWHLNRILKAKSLYAKGESTVAIANILEIHGRYNEQFFRQVRSFGFDQLKSKLDTLLETDMGIKRSRLDQTLMLDLAVIRLCLA